MSFGLMLTSTAVALCDTRTSPPFSMYERTMPAGRAGSVRVVSVGSKICR